MTDRVYTLFPELQRDLHSLSFTTGILPSQKIRELIENGRIAAATPIDDDQIQPSSIDLRLGPVAYRMQSSFLPGANGVVERKLQELVMTTIDLSRPTVFEKGCVYLVPLIERLALPPDVSAKANPKSTTGRLDIFTRLICDGGAEFERVPEGYKGTLYAEIVPRTFTIIVQAGVKLNQLRFIREMPAAVGHHAQKIGRGGTATCTWMRTFPGRPDQRRPHGVVEPARGQERKYHRLPREAKYARRRPAQA